MAHILGDVRQGHRKIDNPITVNTNDAEKFVENQNNKRCNNASNTDYKNFRLLHMEH